MTYKIIYTKTASVQCDCESFDDAENFWETYVEDGDVLMIRCLE